jgi:hypothetical protein
MAEPACWAISSRKARSGSQRISKRHPASSHHKDRVHTPAPLSAQAVGWRGWVALVRAGSAKQRKPHTYSLLRQ